MHPAGGGDLRDPPALGFQVPTQESAPRRGGHPRGPGWGDSVPPEQALNWWDLVSISLHLLSFSFSGNSWGPGDATNM